LGLKPKVKKKGLFLCEKTKFNFEKTHKLKIELMEKRLSMARFRKNEAWAP
jgi:hypothetical protein